MKKEVYCITRDRGRYNGPSVTSGQYTTVVLTLCWFCDLLYEIRMTILNSRISIKLKQFIIGIFHSKAAINTLSVSVHV